MIVSRTELLVCRGLCLALADVEIGATIPESSGFSEMLGALEDEHPWWRYEALDGIVPAVARKIGAREVEILGLGLLMSDNVWVPFHVRLRIADSADELDFIDCKLGERGDGNGGIQRTYHERLSRRLALLERRAEDIEWAYTGGFGSADPLADQM